MAKPNQPKDIKPQESGTAEKGAGTAKSGDSSKIIIITTITTLLICVIFLIINYIMQDMLLSQKLSTIAASTTSEEDTEAEEDDSGIIVDLGEFTMNLADISPRRFLKANVAFEVTKTDKDREIEASAASAGTGGGHGAPAPVDPNKIIEEELNRFKPAIRDAIILTLSSKTYSELSTIPGKETAKEQIAESINTIFNGEREVIRVSFGQFIMQ